MVKSKLLSLIFGMIAVQLSGQPINNEAGDVILPSASVASLNKFIDIPVTKFSGIPDISIPIYTINEGPIQVPVTLAYHASGIKVMEVPSWVGSGWNLFAGGMVNRSIRGLADDSPTGRGYINADNQHVLFNGLGNDEIFTLYDHESDMYHFSFGGYSGKMVYNWTGEDDESGRADNWLMYPHQDLSARAIFNGTRIDGFIFTTPNGLMYTFGGNDIERSRTHKEIHGDEGTSFNTSGWYLQSIKSADDKYWVNFNYEREDYRYKFLTSSSWESYSWNLPFGDNCTGGNSENVEEIYSTISGRRLASITTSLNSFQMEFVAEDDRLDVINAYSGDHGAKALREIRIGQGNESCKSFKFGYSYMGQSHQLDHEKRLRLDFFSESSCNGTIESIPSYIFKYYDEIDGEQIELPSRLSKQVDHWGYYNGVESNEYKSTLIPYNASYDFNGEIYYYHGGNREVSADRESRGDFMKIGTINKIVYPTGASHEFDLGPNTEFGPRRSENPELLLRTTWSNCADPVYSYPADGIVFDDYQVRNAKFELTIDLANDSDVEVGCNYLNSNRPGVAVSANFDDDLSLPAPTTAIPYYETFISPPSYGYHSSGLLNLSEFNLPIEPTVPYLFEIGPYISSNSVSGPVSAQFDITIVPEENIEVGGLRLNSIHKTPGAQGGSQNTETTYYDYNDSEGRSYGQVLIEPLYGFAHHDENVFYTLFRSSSLFDIDNINGHVIGYESVSVQTDNVKTRYYYNIEKYENTTFPFVPILNDYTIGREKEIIYFNNIENVEQTEKFQGYQLQDLSNPAIGTNIKFFKISCSVPPDINFPGSVADYFILQNFTYPNSSYYQLDLVDQIKDGLASRTTFTYSGTHLQPTEVNVSGPSASQTISYKFAEDLAGNPSANLLLTNHMITIPLETIIDGGAGGGSKTEFKLDNGYIVPYKFSRWNNDNSGDWNLVAEHKDFEYGLPTTVEKVGLDASRQITQDLAWVDRLLTSSSVGSRSQTYDYYFDGHRQLESLTSIDGQTITFQYDGLWRLKQEISRGGLIETTYTYNYAPFVGKNSVHKEVDIKDTDYAFNTEQIYDGFGRPIGAIKEKYAASGSDWIESQRYNALGSIINRCDPAQGSCYTYTYYPSPLQRLQTEQQGNWPNPVQYEYGAEDGLYMTKRISEDGVETKTMTDGLGRTRKTVDGLGQATSYGYDGRGNITSISGPAGSYGYEYDGLGRLETKTVPDGGIFTYTYYENDLLKTTTDPKGQSTTNDYTQYGELEYVYNGPSASGAPISTYTYGSGIGDTGKMLTSSVYTSIGGQATKSYDYDNYGRLVNESSSTEYLSANFDHIEIDNADFIKTTNRDNIVYNMDYDHGGRQTSSSTDWNGTTINTSNEYNDNDWRIIHNLGGTLEKPLQKVDYGYNERGWLTNINGIEQIQNRRKQNIIPEIYEDDLTELLYDLKISYDKSDLTNCSPTNVLIELEAQVNILTGINVGSYPIDMSEIIPVNGGNDNMDIYPDQLDYQFYGSLNIDDVMAAIHNDMILEQIIGSDAGTLCGGCSFESVLHPANGVPSTIIFELVVDGQNILNHGYDLSIDQSRLDFISDVNEWLRNNGGGTAAVDQISTETNNSTWQYRVRLNNASTMNSYDYVNARIDGNKYGKSLFVPTSDSSGECQAIGDFHFSFPVDDPCSINRQLVSIRIGSEVLRFDDDGPLYFSSEADRQSIYRKIYLYFVSINLEFRSIEVRPNGLDILGAQVAIGEVTVNCSSGFSE